VATPTAPTRNFIPPLGSPRHYHRTLRDLILISKMQGTAVLTAVPAGRAQPSGAKLCALIASSYVLSPCLSPQPQPPLFCPVAMAPCSLVTDDLVLAGGIRRFSTTTDISPPLSLWFMIIASQAIGPLTREPGQGSARLQHCTGSRKFTPPLSYPSGHDLGLIR
jgi:hypothetical protein